MAHSIPGLPDEIGQAMETCFKQLDSVIHQQTAEQQKFAVPAILYHYTDGSGLLGIIESGLIRLTDIFGVNDPSEIRHGVERACSVFEHTARGHRASDLFSRQFGETLRGEIENVVRMFVASFSRSGDDLSQWRAYAANGSGFALGFAGAALEQAFLSLGTDRNTTIHVLYDDGMLSQAMERLVSPAVHLLDFAASRGLPDNVIRNFLTVVANQLSVAVLHAAMLFKHQAYSDEDEYRFLQVRLPGDHDRDLKRRARGSRIIRFAEFDWRRHTRDALREVVIGPAANEGAARTFIHECLGLGRLQLDAIVIRRSAIPYRG